VCVVLHFECFGGPTFGDLLQSVEPQHQNMHSIVVTSSISISKQLSACLCGGGGGFCSF
jgi:hypothetical protein